MKRLVRLWTPPRGPALALAPHPDDESLGCGGALALHARRGDRVRVVIVTDGARGDKRGLTPRLAGARRREARAACRALGVAAPEHWDYPDGRLSGARGLTKRLCALLRSYRPAVVYVPAEDDPHPDHRALARAARRALKAARSPAVRCRYEVLSAAKPDALLDVSGVFARKLRAVAAHRSQAPYLPAGQAHRRAVALGLLAGVRYAEGYRKARPSRG